MNYHCRTCWDDERGVPVRDRANRIGATVWALCPHCNRESVRNSADHGDSRVQERVKEAKALALGRQTAVVTPRGEHV